MCVVSGLLSVKLSGPSGCRLEDNWMCVRWWVSVNMCVRFNWVWVVHDFIVDNLWLGELEDDHSECHDEGKESEGHCLPGLEGDQGESEGNENCRLELETQQEGDHDFLDETATCK